MNIKDYMAKKDEKPLDNIVTDGGMCGIFRAIGFIGDSLSSGEFETLNEDGSKNYIDCFPYSWGQYIARAAGLTARNFSRGGMTAKEYVESFAEANGFWSEELLCQAYVIALGVNDIYGLNMEIGSEDDIKDDYTQNGKTFIGYYAYIIQRLKAMNPEAKFFLVTVPQTEMQKEQDFRISAAVRRIAACFDKTYLIDLEKYAPVYDEEFRENFYLLGHLNPAGYLLTGKIIASYIDYIVRNNPEDFKLAGLIPYKA